MLLSVKVFDLARKFMTNNVVVSRITLFSSKMDKTAEFYNAIGLSLQRSGSWSGYYNYLDIIKNNGQDIIFEIYPLEFGSPVISPQGLGFDVDNVPIVLKNLMEMETPVLRPENPRMYSCCTLAIVRDPDGRTVTITQHER